MIRVLLAAVLLLLSAQESVAQIAFPLYRPPVSTGGGGSAHYVNVSTPAVDSGSYTPSVTYSCINATDVLVALVGNDAGITAPASSTANSDIPGFTWEVTSESGAGDATYVTQGFVGACSDTTSHTWTWTYHNTYVHGNNFFILVEISPCTLDAVGGSANPAAGTDMDASATTTGSSGMAIVSGYSHGFTPSAWTPSGYVARYQSANRSVWTLDSAYAAPGTVSFATTSPSLPSGAYPTVMLAFHP